MKRAARHKTSRLCGIRQLQYHDVSAGLLGRTEEGLTADPTAEAHPGNKLKLNPEARTVSKRYQKTSVLHPSLVARYVHSEASYEPLVITKHLL